MALILGTTGAPWCRLLPADAWTTLCLVRDKTRRHSLLSAAPTASLASRHLCAEGFDELEVVLFVDELLGRDGVIRHIVFESHLNERTATTATSTTTTTTLTGRLREALKVYMNKGDNITSEAQRVTRSTAAQAGGRKG